MREAQPDLFWELSGESQFPASSPATEETVTDTPDVPQVDPLLLRRVAVDPVAMARALVLIKSFAAKYGLDPSERGEVAMFVRERDILFAADWDRGYTQTADGEPRPFHFRYSVPLVDVGEGRALWVGARIRPQDLQEAFRNRVENSDQYGVLGAGEPVRLELFSSPDDEPEPRPVRIVVHPSGDGSLEPREVFPLGGVSLYAFQHVEPVLADFGASALDPDALVDLAALASDAIGIRVHPWNHKVYRKKGAQPIQSFSAYAVAVGPRGIAVTNFEGNLSETTRLPSSAQSDLLGDVAKTQVERTPVPQGNALVDEVVLTPRFAHVLGITQGAFEEAMRVLQRPVTADWELKMSAAAVAAALDDNPSIAQALRTKIGRTVVGAALTSTQNQSVRDRAIAVTRHLQARLQPMEIAAVAAGLPVQPGVGLEALRVEFNDDAALIRLAAALSASELSEEALAGIVGEVLLIQEVKHVISRSGDARPVETATTVDLALAALRLAGKSYRAFAEDLVRDINDPGRWWESYRNYMRALGVPENAIDALMRTDPNANRLGRPTGRSLRAPAKTREQWVAQARLPVQGRFWRTEDGRCWAGFGHEDVGYVWFNDLPVQPDPHKYPLQHGDVVRLVSRSMAIDEPSLPVHWQATLHRDDLQSLVNRVVGLTNPDASTAAPKALLVARWTPDGLGEPDGALPLQDPRFADESARLRPQTVYIGEGPGAQRFEVEPDYANDYLHAREHGSLRVYGFEQGGEALWFEVPMYAGWEAVRPEGRNPGEAYAFALDADGLHDAVEFVTQRGLGSTLNLLDGVVRVHDPQMHRLIFVPTIERSRVPEAYRPVLRATGVPLALGKPLALTEVIAQARDAAVVVDEERSFPEYPDKPAVRWRLVADPGILASEDVYLKASINPFVRQELLLREIARLRHDLAIGTDGLPDLFGNQTAPADAYKPKRIQTQLKKKLAELERLQEELPAYMHIGNEVKTGLVRPGQGERRFVTPEQIFEEETDLVVDVEQEERSAWRR